MALIQAGADPNVKSKKGNDAFDALLMTKTYLPESWDGYATAKFLLNGAVFWPPLERFFLINFKIYFRSEIKLYRITSMEHKNHLLNLIRQNPFLTDYQKQELTG